VGNPAPSLASRRVPLSASPRVIGKDGLKLQLRTGSAGSMEAVGWGMADLKRELGDDEAVDVVYRLERDTWGGASRLQARLVDVQRSSDEIEVPVAVVPAARVDAAPPGAVEPAVVVGVQPRQDDPRPR
jgi:hypothetical protein